MNIQQVLRPIDTKRNKNLVFSTRADPGAFAWVHLDNGGQPLCGEEYDMERYDFRIEQIDLDDPEAIKKYGSSHVCRGCAALYYSYEVLTLQAGQPRAYADSEYRYCITDVVGGRQYDDVLHFARTHIKFGYLHDEEHGWSHPEIKGFGQAQSGEWIYHVTEAFTG